MKKLTLPILFAFVLAFSACEKTTEKSMVGLWKLEKSTYTATDNSNVIEETPAVEVRYKKDGTGTSTYVITGSTQSFEWYLSEDYTQITYTSKNGSSESCHVDQLSENHLAISQETNLDTTGTVYLHLKEYSKIDK